MKISLNWLKKYVKIPEEVSDAELIRLIGARLVEVEGVIDETHKYNNIVVVKVEKAEKIPDTHLTLCQINDGGPELVQVVCGAPNVREGMLAVWIKPGAIVPASVHDAEPFVIGKRKMLGKYESNGMLSGADELDFGGGHDSIAEIDSEMAKPGDLLADIFGLNDLILEIENKSLTHRPDCFGIIGFAREVAGILGIRFETPEFLLKEEVFPEGFLEEYKDGVRSRNTGLEIMLSNLEICPRYSAAVLKVNEPESKEKYLSKMRILISKAGMQSVSRIVDVTNYLMLLTGQPLHAFDFNKFLSVGGSETAKIGVRLARDGETLELLDGKMVKCQPFDILITSNDVPVGLAGAMGGKNTEIDSDTKEVLLESATFSLYNLRKTQMAHGIFSEAITRFTKGVPAGGTFNVMAEAAKEIKGEVLEVVDCYPNPISVPDVRVSADEINGLLGTKYTYNEIERTLKNVGFEISCDCGEKDVCGCEYINVTTPYWRTDIHIKEDVIEEVGRLLGYESINPSLPLHGTATKNEMLELKKNLRDLLSRYGANEVLTYSFVSERLLEKAQQDKENSYRIVNSISPELQYIRQSIAPSLLEKVYLNEKLPVERFAIFEMNQVYRKDFGLNNEKVPMGRNSLGFVVAERKGKGTAFYKAKKYVAKVFESLNIVAEFLPAEVATAESMPFELKRTAKILVNGEYVGVVGEFKNSVRNEFKLAEYLAGFEIDLDLALKNRGEHRKAEIGVKKVEDLTVTTDRTYLETLKEVREQYPEAKIDPLSIYRADGEEKKNISFRITTFKEK